MKPFTFAIACALFATTTTTTTTLWAQGAGQRDRALKTIPIRHLLFRAGAPAAPRLNTLLQAEESPKRLLPERAFRLLEPDQLVELVRTAAGSILEEGDVSLNLLHGMLMVTGPKKAVTAVENAVHSIAGVMCRRLQLEARIYETNGNRAYPAVIKASEMAKTTAQTRPGTTVATNR